MARAVVPFMGFSGREGLTLRPSLGGAVSHPGHLRPGDRALGGLKPETVEEVALLDWPGGLLCHLTFTRKKARITVKNGI